jgi:hypothetical protein
MHKSKCRNKRNMRKQGNMTPPRVNNSTVRDTNDSEVDESLDKEFKRMIIIMIKESKETMSKCLNEFQGYANKQLSEIRKIMQKMKEKFYKVLDTQKKKIKSKFWKCKIQKVK